MKIPSYKYIYNPTGSIGLATNAGNYFFLHDLAQRYTKKMEIYMEANPIFAFEKKPSEPQVTSSGSSETAESTEVNHFYVQVFLVSFQQSNY